MYKNDRNFALVFIHEDAFVVPFPKMTPFFWYNTCVTYNSDTREAIAFVNGEIKANKVLKAGLTKETFNPDLVKNLMLGQSVKYKSNNHVLKGKISQLNIWSSVINSYVLEEFTRNGSTDTFTQKPDVLDWNTVEFDLGDLVIVGKVASLRKSWSAC